MVRSRTTNKEKIRRIEYISAILMEKYHKLVWYARTDAEKLIEEERYEILQSVKEVENVYPEETNELQSDDSNWTHGFNSGMLACVRFLLEYMEDGLWEVCEDNEDMVPYEKIVTIDGKEYIEFNGRETAQELFPHLDT